MGNAKIGLRDSASHNPYQDNGIKIFSGSGFKLSDEQEETIEDLMLSNTLHTLVPPVKDMGAKVSYGGCEWPIHCVFKKHLSSRFIHRRDEDLSWILQMVLRIRLLRIPSGNLVRI